MSLSTTALEQCPSKPVFYLLDKAVQIITSGNIPKKNCLNYLFLQQSLYGAFYVNAHHDRNLQKLSQTFSGRTA